MIPDDWPERAILAMMIIAAFYCAIRLIYGPEWD